MSDLTDAAKATLNLVDTAIKGDISSLINENGWTDLQKPLQDVSRLLVSGRALARQSNGTWSVNPDVVDTMDDTTLKAISKSGQDIATALNASDRIETLQASGKQSVLEAALATGESTSRASGDMADLSTLRDAISPKAEPVYSQVPSDDRLHAVARTSLDVLEKMHFANPSVENTENGRKTVELQNALEDRLAEASYLLPGESETRTTPYREQSYRGTREQGLAILEAADGYTDHLMQKGALRDVDFANPLVEGTVSLSLGHLQSAVKSAREEEPVLLEGQATIAPSEPSYPLSQERAGALLGVIDIGNKIADAAQFDTQEPEMVMFPRALLRESREALEKVDSTSADISLREIREEGVQLPGVSDASSKAMNDLVDELRHMNLNADRRFEARNHQDLATTRMLDDGFVAISQTDMDKISSLSERMSSSGAQTGIAAMAGQSEQSALSMTEGRDSAAFGTMADAMRGGGRNPPPDSSLGTMGKALPEMDVSEWKALSQKVRTQAQVVMLVPGQGDFVHYDPGAPIAGVPKAKVWRENRLRKAIRDRLADETPITDRQGNPGKQTVGERFKEHLGVIRHRNIVAPTRDDARILREEAERVVEDQMRQRRERVEAGRADIQRTPADMPAQHVKRFLDIVEASGSTAPAELKKSGDKLILTHPDGPTLSPDVPTGLRNMQKHEDGHRIALVSLEGLRGAMESGQPKVRLMVEEDRVGAIIGHTPTAERKRQQSQVEAA